METLEQGNNRVADPRFAGPSNDPNDSNGFRLYWLAFLLTGHRGLSADVTLEAIAFPDDANPFFSAWMLAWSRRGFIEKTLAGICDEIGASARRTGPKERGKGGLPPPKL